MMLLKSKNSFSVLAALLLSACAVGPNYKQPHAPETSGFVPAGALPATTASAPLPGGDPQHFVDGLDIPGQWWSLFKSAELNALIERGLANSPTLEAAQAAIRCNPAWRREFLHLTMRRGRQIATVALARKLAIRLYWMWRNGRDYEMSLQFGSHVGQPGTAYGVK